MTSTFARVAAGVPTGGQFATTTHREANVSLGVPGATDGFDDGTWSVSSFTNEIGDTAARRHLAAADGQLGSALATAIEEANLLERGLLPRDHDENPNGFTTERGVQIPADGTYVTAALLHGSPIEGVTVGTAGHGDAVNAFIRTDSGRVHYVDPDTLAPADGPGWREGCSSRNGDQLTVDQLDNGAYRWQVGPPGQPAVFAGYDDTEVEARAQAELISDGTAAARTRIATEAFRARDHERERDDAVLREMLRGANPDSIEPPF